MVDNGGDARGSERGHHGRALAAAGIVGTWERDHRRHTFRLCRGAAELLAGDPDLAWRDLTHQQALTNVCADDLSWLRDQMHRAANVPGLHIREYRVRSGPHGVRRVLPGGGRISARTVARATPRG